MAKRIEYDITNSDGTKQRVKGWTTCVPYFAVKRSGSGTYDRWNIDHIPTGRNVKYGFERRSDASIVAGALSGLPIQWATITDDDQLNAREARELLGTQLYNWMIS